MNTTLGRSDIEKGKIFFYRYVAPPLIIWDIIGGCVVFRIDESDLGRPTGVILINNLIDNEDYSNEPFELSR